MINFVAVENNQRAGLDLKFELYDILVRIARMQVAKQARAGFIFETDQHGPAPIFVIRGVVMPAHVIAFFGIGVKSAPVRVIGRTFIHLGADDATEESEQRRTMIETGDRRSESIHRMVSNAAALLVSGKIVAMNVRLECFQFNLQSSQQLNGQEIVQAYELVMR